jgi:glyoxylase-like metal-dependent hydrolase (beta-lactamase superfamily II)
MILRALRGAALAVVVALGLASLGCASSEIVGHAPAGVPIIRIPLRLSNAYLLKTRTPVLIDSGTIGDMEELASGLASFGVRTSDLGAVVVTHGHADHAGLAADLRRASGAKIFLGAGDVPLARVGHNDVLLPTSFTARVLGPFIPDVYPELEPDVAVREPATLAPWGIDGKVVAMPGHTPGSVVVLLANHAAFVGDALAGGSLGGLLWPSSPTEHLFHATGKKPAVTSASSSRSASRRSTWAMAVRSRARTSSPRASEGTDTWKTE